MSTMLAARFRQMLDFRGLLMAAHAHEERFVFHLAQGAIAVNRHPTHVRETAMIAKAVYAEGQGEHAELLGLFARRDELETPDDRRVIEWGPYSAEGPGLNPEKWVRLDAWLTDQFLLEDALAKLDEGVPI